jgi:prolyl-tRNA synthetase
MNFYHLLLDRHNVNLKQNNSILRKLGVILQYQHHKFDNTKYIAHLFQMFLNADIIFHTHAGVFTYLPLGLRALEKLTHLIDEEMQDIGAQKIAMPTLIKSSLWKKTGVLIKYNKKVFKLSQARTESVNITLACWS